MSVTAPALKTMVDHHNDCPHNYAWDVAQEMYVACSCPKFWPRRKKVCAQCWTTPNRCRCAPSPSGKPNTGGHE